jgi:hypothetical protein
MEDKIKPEKVKIKTQQIELPKFNADEFIGQKVLIEKIETLKGEFGYFVKLETQQVATWLKDGVKTPIMATRMFSLQKDAEGHIGWGKDTKLGEYLKYKKVAHFDDLLGKEVKIQVNEKGFLTFT